MRFIDIYLIIYFAIVVGAVVALGAGGVLGHVSVVWVVIPLAVAVGLGALLAVITRRNAGT